jgi:hypothetical protein
MTLGIPIKSELVKKSVLELRRMPEADIEQLRQELDVLYNQMNNYDNEHTIDGQASERHWFLMHGKQYAWVPLELMP